MNDLKDIACEVVKSCLGRGRPKRFLTDEEKEQITQKYLEGVKIYKIAKELNISNKKVKEFIESIPKSSN